MASKLVLTRYSFYRISLIVCTVIMLGFFLLFPNEIIGGYTVRFSVAMYGCLLALSTVNARNNVFKHYRKTVNSIAIIYSLCVIIAVINTLVSYHYSVYELSIAVMPYLYFYFAYPLLYLFCKDGGIEKTMSCVVKWVLIFLGIKGICWLLYVFAGIVIFPQMLFEYGDSWVRNGMQRVNAGYLVGIVLAYCVAKGFSINKRNIYKILTVYIILFLWFITAFRFQFIVAVLTVVACIYFSDTGNRSRLTNRIVIIAFVIIAILSPFASDLIDSFSSENAIYGASTTLRVLTIEHFYNLMKDNNPIIGLGLLVSENSIAQSLIRKSQWILFYLEDIGIIGSWFKFGILTLGIYGQMFYWGIKNVISKSNSKEVSKMFMIGVVVYLLFSSLMMSIFDLQRAFDVPFYVALICYYRCVLREQGKMLSRENGN